MSAPWSLLFDSILRLMKYAPGSFKGQMKLNSLLEGDKRRVGAKTQFKRLLERHQGAEGHHIVKDGLEFAVHTGRRMWNWNGTEVMGTSHQDHPFSFWGASTLGMKRGTSGGGNFWKITIEGRKKQHLGSMLTNACP